MRLDRAPRPWKSRDEVQRQLAIAGCVFRPAEGRRDVTAEPDGARESIMCRFHAFQGRVSALMISWALSVVPARTCAKAAVAAPIRPSGLVERRGSAAALVNSSVTGGPAQVDDLRLIGLDTEELDHGGRGQHLRLR